MTLQHVTSAPVLASVNEDTEVHHDETGSTGSSKDANVSIPSMARTVSTGQFTSDSSLSDEEIELAAKVMPHTGYKKVLVTGGAGFIGSHVADYLLERGDDVVIVDEVNDYYDVRIKEENLRLLKEKYSEDRLVIYRCDICDHDKMEEIFDKERPGWVCHMAARAGVRPSINDPFFTSTAISAGLLI